MDDSLCEGHFNIGDEPTFGHAQDDLPFEELRAVCGPFNCSQVILAEQHEALGISVEEARRVGLVLGGGMWHGSTCGSLLAAIVAAGYLEQPMAVPTMIERFAEEAGAISCPSIVHSNTSCAKCIALGRELVASMVLTAKGEGEQTRRSQTSGDYAPGLEFAVSHYSGSERAVVIPEGVTEVLPHAFEGRTSLRNVLFPSSLRRIGDYAFAGCTGLRNVVLQDGIEEVGAHSFEGCAALMAVDLPMTVEHVGVGAFEGCPVLKKGNLDKFETGREEA